MLSKPILKYAFLRTFYLTLLIWRGVDLERQAAIADAEIEVGAVAFDSDRSFVVVDEGDDVNGFVLAVVDGVAEEIP